jgi:hypothetical protein
MRRVVVLLIAYSVIAWWQHGFTRDDAIIPPGYSVTASTGINQEAKFFFYLYHLNLFPVASGVAPKEDTRAEAERLMREFPKQLKQDDGTTFRSGDRGRTYLYFVDAWLRHDSLNPRLRPAHLLAFTLALCALFTSFWSLRRSWAGAPLVVFFGSSPFQLHNVFGQDNNRDNVFSWTITALIVVLAIHLPLLDRPRKPWRYYPWVAAVGTGVFFAIVRNFRGEMTVLLASPVLVYLTMTTLRIRVRVVLAALMALTFYVGTLGATAFVDSKVREAGLAVARAGGSPYEGPIRHFHEFWHVMWCGLGDFDKTKGYAWSDGAAYRYAAPELSKRNDGLEIQINNAQKRTYDAAGKYPVYFVEIPHYDEILREKIFHDIKEDPGWYIHIMRLRLTRTFSNPTPVGLALHTHSFYLSGGMLAWGSLALAAWLALKRRWAYLKMMVFAAPLTLAPVLVYSGGGMTNYSSFHVIGTWVAAMLVFEGLRSVGRRRTRFRLTA